MDRTDQMRLVFLFIFFTFMLVCSAQQDPQYSQYMFNRTLINPAYIGSRDVTALTGQIRKEWVNVKGSPQTNNLTASVPLRGKNMALGGHLTAESIGPKRWLSGYLDYAYRLKFRNGSLCFGLSTGVVAYDFTPSRIDLYDPNEPTLNNSKTRAVRFDAGCGIYYFTRSFYAGLSSTHLTTPGLFEGVAAGAGRFYNLSRHFFLTIGKGFRLNNDLVFNPSLMVKAVPAQQVNADVSASVIIRSRLTTGISLRSSSNIVALVQYFVSDKLRIGYSYDYGLKGIARTSAGSHELTLHFDMISTKSNITTTRLL